MDQSLFFAGSFGRLGFDFRTSLVVLFEDHVFDRLQECWAKAIAEFRGALDVPLFDSGDDKHGTKDVVRIGLSSVHFISSEPSHVQRIDNDYTPPRQLLGFPILVDFTNAVLSSLNNLRLCLITSLRIRMKKRFLKMTVDFAQAISDFTRQMNLEGLCNDGRERSKKSKGFIQAVESMIKVSESILIPYLFDCFSRLYPDHQLDKCNTEADLELDGCLAILKGLETE
ncbi:hypothetical protein ABG067_002841 [Albugo candida]